MTPGPGIRRGRVATFDGERGLGTIRVEDGGELPFHCTAIAGGTRTIDPGADVVFETAAGPGGRWWATSVLPV